MSEHPTNRRSEFQLFSRIWHVVWAAVLQPIIWLDHNVQSSIIQLATFLKMDNGAKTQLCHRLHEHQHEVVSNIVTVLILRAPNRQTSTEGFATRVNRDYHRDDKTASIWQAGAFERRIEEDPSGKSSKRVKCCAGGRQNLVTMSFRETGGLKGICIAELTRHIWAHEPDFK